MANHSWFLCVSTSLCISYKILTPKYITNNQSMPLIRKNQKPTFARFFNQEKILGLKLLDFFAKRIALRLARNFLNSFRCFSDSPGIELFSQKP